VSINALGYVTENYDPLGRVRTTEPRYEDGTSTIVAELPIETRVVGPLGASDEAVITDAIDLGEHLAQSGAVHGCMVQQYFGFLAGRKIDRDGDGCDLEALSTALTGTDGSIREMLKASALLPSFRQRKLK
jgi:hypothetical protein